MDPLHALSSYLIPEVPEYNAFSDGKPAATDDVIQLDHNGNALAPGAIYADTDDPPIDFPTENDMSWIFSTENRCVHGSPAETYCDGLQNFGQFKLATETPNGNTPYSCDLSTNLLTKTISSDNFLTLKSLLNSEASHMKPPDSKIHNDRDALGNNSISTTKTHNSSPCVSDIIVIAPDNIGHADTEYCSSLSAVDNTGGPGTSTPFCANYDVSECSLHSLDYEKLNIPTVVGHHDQTTREITKGTTPVPTQITQTRTTPTAAIVTNVNKVTALDILSCVASAERVRLANEKSPSLDVDEHTIVEGTHIQMAKNRSLNSSDAPHLSNVSFDSYSPISSVTPMPPSYSTDMPAYASNEWPPCTSYPAQCHQMIGDQQYTSQQNNAKQGRKKKRSLQLQKVVPSVPGHTSQNVFRPDQKKTGDNYLKHNQKYQARVSQQQDFNGDAPPLLPIGAMKLPTAMTLPITTSPLDPSMVHTSIVPRQQHHEKSAGHMQPQMIAINDERKHQSFDLRSQAFTGITDQGNQPNVCQLPHVFHNDQINSRVLTVPISQSNMHVGPPLQQFNSPKYPKPQNTLMSSVQLGNMSSIVPSIGLYDTAAMQPSASVTTGQSRNTPTYPKQRYNASRAHSTVPSNKKSGGSVTPIGEQATISFPNGAEPGRFNNPVPSHTFEKRSSGIAPSIQKHHNTSLQQMNCINSKPNQPSINISQQNISNASSTFSLVRQCRPSIQSHSFNQRVVNPHRVSTSQSKNQSTVLNLSVSTVSETTGGLCREPQSKIATPCMPADDSTNIINTGISSDQLSMSPDCLLAVISGAAEQVTQPRLNISTSSSVNPLEPAQIQPKKKSRRSKKISQNEDVSAPKSRKRPNNTLIVCNLCQHTVKYNLEWKKHIREKHWDLVKTFNCKECFLTFPSKVIFIDHVMLDHPKMLPFNLLPEKLFQPLIEEHKRFKKPAHDVTKGEIAPVQQVGLKTFACAAQENIARVIDSYTRRPVNRSTQSATIHDFNTSTMTASTKPPLSATKIQSKQLMDAKLMTTTTAVSTAITPFGGIMTTATSIPVATSTSVLKPSTMSESSNVAIRTTAATEMPTTITTRKTISAPNRMATFTKIVSPSITAVPNAITSPTNNVPSTTTGISTAVMTPIKFEGSTTITMSDTTYLPTVRKSVVAMALPTTKTPITTAVRATAVLAPVVADGKIKPCETAIMTSVVGGSPVSRATSVSIITPVLNTTPSVNMMPATMQPSASNVAVASGTTTDPVTKPYMSTPTLSPVLATDTEIPLKSPRMTGTQSNTAVSIVVEMSNSVISAPLLQSESDDVKYIGANKNTLSFPTLDDFLTKTRNRQTSTTPSPEKTSTTPVDTTEMITDIYADEGMISDNDYASTKSYAQSPDRSLSDAELFQTSNNEDDDNTKDVTDIMDSLEAKFPNEMPDFKSLSAFDSTDRVKKFLIQYGTQDAMSNEEPVSDDKSCIPATEKQIAEYDKMEKSPKASVAVQPRKFIEVGDSKTKLDIRPRLLHANLRKKASNMRRKRKHISKQGERQYSKRRKVRRQRKTKTVDSCSLSDDCDDVSLPDLDFFNEHMKSNPDLETERQTPLLQSSQDHSGHDSIKDLNLVCFLAETPTQKSADENVMDSLEIPVDQKNTPMSCVQNSISTDKLKTTTGMAEIPKTVEHSDVAYPRVTEIIKQETVPPTPCESQNTLTPAQFLHLDSDCDDIGEKVLTDDVKGSDFQLTDVCKENVPSTMELEEEIGDCSYNKVLTDDIEGSDFQLTGVSKENVASTMELEDEITDCSYNKVLTDDSEGSDCQLTDVSKENIASTMELEGNISDCSYYRGKSMTERNSSNNSGISSENKATSRITATTRCYVVFHRKKIIDELACDSVRVDSNGTLMPILTDAVTLSRNDIPVLKSTSDDQMSEDVAVNVNTLPQQQIIDNPSEQDCTVTCLSVRSEQLPVREPPDHEDVDDLKADIKWGCMLCTLHCSDQDEMKQHIRSTHIVPKLFFCPMCSHTSLEYNDTENHILSVHRDVTAVVLSRRCPKEVDLVDSLCLSLPRELKWKNVRAKLSKIAKMAIFAKTEVIFLDSKRYTCLVCSKQIRSSALIRRHVAIHWKQIGSNHNLATPEESKEIFIDDEILVELFHNLKYRPSLKRHSAPVAPLHEFHGGIAGNLTSTENISVKRNGESVPYGKCGKIQRENDCDVSTNYIDFTPSVNDDVNTPKENTFVENVSSVASTNSCENITLKEEDDKVSTSSDVLLRSGKNKDRGNCRSVWATIEKEYGTPAKDVLVSPIASSASTSPQAESFPTYPNFFSFPSPQHMSTFSASLKNCVKSSSDERVSSTTCTEQPYSPALSTDSKASCSTCHSTTTVAYKDRLPGADSSYVTTKGTYSDCARSYVGSDIKLHMRPIVVLEYLHSN